MFSLGTSEILVILIVALVVFGKRLPEVARSMGNALSEFRRGLTGLQREFNEEIMREPRPPAAPRPPASRETSVPALPAAISPPPAAPGAVPAPAPPPAPAAPPTPIPGEAPDRLAPPSASDSPNSVQP